MEIVRSALLQEKVSKRDGVIRTTRSEIAETLTRGYAVHDYNTPIERTGAIAVPVFSGSTAVAAMVLIYPRDALRQSQIDNILLPKLREVSGKISLQYARGQQ